MRSRPTARNLAGTRCAPTDSGLFVDLVRDRLNVLAGAPHRVAGGKHQTARQRDDHQYLLYHLASPHSNRRETMRRTSLSVNARRVAIVPRQDWRRERSERSDGWEGISK